MIKARVTSLRIVKIILKMFDSYIPKVYIRVRMNKKATASIEQFSTPNTVKLVIPLGRM